LIVREDLFFFMAVFSSVAVGLVILLVIGISKLTGIGLDSMDYMAVAVGLYLVFFSVSLLWLRNKFFAETEQEELFEKLKS
jgi:hypothetical protein